MVPQYHTKCEIKFCGSFVRVQSSFLSPRGTRFPPHLFSTHLSLSGKPHLYSWERLLKYFNLCMYILRTGKQGGGKLMFMPFEIVSICVGL